MRSDEVPQHKAKAFMGHAKALYATDDKGDYRLVGSDGWEAEELVLDQAIEEFQQLAAQALERAQRGEASALEVHMYRRRMDLTLLAQSTGFWEWQVRRHLKPGAFERLAPPKQARYVEALRLSLEELRALPAGPL